MSKRKLYIYTPYNHKTKCTKTKQRQTKHTHFIKNKNRKTNTTTYKNNLFRAHTRTRDIHTHIRV